MFEVAKPVRMRPGSARSAPHPAMQASAGWGANRFGIRRPANLSARRALGDDPYMAASPQLASSPIHRGHRATIPRREALMLQAVINHSWLLHYHLEEFARVELRHFDAAKIKAAVIDIFAQGGASDAADVMAELARRGLAEASNRIEKVITTSSVWAVRSSAAPDDVLTTWKQLVTLHHQDHLAKELKEVEHALGQEATDANYSRLQDVKAQQATAEGTEAVIEGFGTLSGRPIRSV